LLLLIFQLLSEHYRNTLHTFNVWKDAAIEILILILVLPPTYYIDLEELVMPKYEYLTNQQMNSYYAEVCRAMAHAQYKPDVIIALSRGGLDFGVKLSNWFDDVELVPLVWQTRDGATKDLDKLHNVLSEYNGGTVLIVDDILDSGATLQQIEKALADYESVVVDYAVAIENIEAEFEITWSGREISRTEDTQWFIFPWEDWWKR
jgi:hypoxanthine phosphoribosyltransferase